MGNSSHPDAGMWQLVLRAMRLGRNTPASTKTEASAHGIKLLRRGLGLFPLFFSPGDTHQNPNHEKRLGFLPSPITAERSATRRRLEISARE